MKLLFVCMGNAYRSRLAEAYLKSLHLPNLSVASAGVEARQDQNGPICSYTTELLHEYNLTQYGKPHWTQLTQELLSQADLVVCMNRLVHEAGLQAGYQFPLRTFIWDIADVNQIIRDWPHHRERVPLIAHRTFHDIVAKTNWLAAYLRRRRPAEQIDILQPDGTPTGRTTDVDTIHTHGLWHQGVHAAIVTPTRKALLQKRSATIIVNPGLWDFTMGGISGAGEHPDDTLRRELTEEMGLHIRPQQIFKLFTWRYNHYIPTYALHSRALVHTYLVVVPHPEPLHFQASEVADARYLSLGEARRFVNSGHSRLGEITHTRQYYNRLLDAATEAAHSYSL
jgi:protein-tyrosine-phosphatase/8-oxo-dGTP pyrophosphatase MutT (NUDIX family)